MLPLKIQIITNEGGGNPIYATRTLATAAAVVQSGICDHLKGIDRRTPAADAFPRVAARGHGFTVFTEKGQFSATLHFRSTTGRWKLIRYAEK